MASSRTAITTRWSVPLVLLALIARGHAVPRPLEFVSTAARPFLGGAGGQALSPDGANLYVVSRDVYYPYEDGINVFARDPATGRLSFVEVEVDRYIGESPIAVSPDGLHVYAGSSYPSGIGVYSRDGGTGALSFIGYESAAVAYPSGITMSADGAHVYISDDGVIQVLSRNALTGALTLVETETDGVGGVNGFNFPTAPVLSPDGASLYVGHYSDDTVAFFSRNAGTGALTFVGLVRDGVGGVDGLEGVEAIALSADGAHLYATSSVEDAVAVFSRDGGTGVLTFVEVERNGVAGVAGLSNPNSLTVSPDGSHVYVAAHEGTVAVFARNAGTGALAFIASQAVWYVGFGSGGAFELVSSLDGAQLYVLTQHNYYEGRVTILGRNAATGALTAVNTVGQAHAERLVVSPDGAHLYGIGVGGFTPRLVAFSRDPGMGALRFIETYFSGVGGIDYLDYDSEIAISSDGAHVYVSSGDAVLVFSRDVGTGRLAFVEAKRDAVDGVDGLGGAASVTVSPDGSHVYVGSSIDDAVAVFSRNAGTGGLTFVEMKRDGVGGADGLDGAVGVAISPDGSHLYVAGSEDDAVAIFGRNTGTGALTFVAVMHGGVGGVDGLENASQLALSPDGTHLYVRGNADPVFADQSGTLAVFARDAGTGTLAFLEVEKDGEGGVSGIGAGLVFVAPDGEQVYAGRYRPFDAGGAIFTRDPATGRLHFVTTSDGPTGVSPDGMHFYAGYHFPSPFVHTYAPGFAGCGLTPLTGCRVSHTGTLRIIVPTLVNWRWLRGELTDPADYGNPATSTDYALCIYDESGPPDLVYRGLMPAGGACRASGTPCWRQVAAGFKYRDSFSTPEGLQIAQLKPGASGAAQILVKSGRKNVTLPTLPLGLPVRVQLQASTGGCWEATYSSASYNSGVSFQAQAD